MITAESIKDMLEDYGYEVMGIHIRAENALRAIEQEKPDLAILDIHLKGEKTGIWLAEQIRANHQIPYIFLTSYADKKTIEEAAETAPYGYLLKPIEKQHLFATVEIAVKKFGELHTVDDSADTDSMMLKDALFVKDEYMFVKVKYDDILFVKANGNYLEIHTETKKHLIKGTMSTFAESLPAEQFFQTHRSYILNITCVEAFGGNYVKINDTDIPITAQKRDALISQINLYQKG